MPPKQAAFDRLHDWLRGLPGEPDVRREISTLCARHGVNEDAISQDLCLSWNELKPFADDPLVTIGAHSISHCNLARQSEAIAAHEMATSRARIEAVLQRPVLHLAYPYGDRNAAGAREFALARSLGFKTAVTTRPGMIFAENAGASHRAAAGVPERQLSGQAISAGADLRRGHRTLERISPRRRGVSPAVLGVVRERSSPLP